MLVIVDGWVRGPRCVIAASHSSWYERNRTCGLPLGILAHYTATEPGTAITMAKKRRKARLKDDRIASWHFTIGTDGTIWQQVNCLDTAWHCGRGGAIVAGIGYTANAAFLGIEIEGMGKVFPPEQVQAATALWTALVHAYKIPQRCAMLEHSRFDPERRSDPGPVWMSHHADGVLRSAYWLAAVADMPSLTITGYKDAA